MSSQGAVYASPTTVTPELGKGALDTWWLSYFGSGSRLDKTGVGATTVQEAKLWVNHKSRGVCEPAFKPRQTGKAHGRKAKVSNRTWETRMSGIIGGPRET
jgi:hypothetical protein